MPRSSHARDWLVLGLIAILSTGDIGCRKLLAPPVKLHELAAGISKAGTQHKLVLLVFGAEWDVTSSMLERETLADRGVRALIDEDFVVAKVDCSDATDPVAERERQRFKVVMEPAVLVLGRDFSTVIAREYQFMNPAAMTTFLREAREKAPR